MGYRLLEAYLRQVTSAVVDIKIAELESEKKAQEDAKRHLKDVKQSKTTKGS